MNFLTGNMDVLEAILRRRSIRRFKERNIKKEEVAEILKAARWTPSAGNRQPWEIIVVRDRDLIEELAEISLEQDWMKSASLIFVVCLNEELAEGSYGKRGVEVYGMQATGALIENMLLRITEMGLGACWVGSFDEDRVEDLIKTHEEKVRPVAMIPVGYPKKTPGPPPRREINAFSHVDEYKGKNLRNWRGLVKCVKKAKLETKRFMNSLREDSENNSNNQE